ncbi:MAG: energy transducer TonB [Proteobacteria bacterium]|nr:energy transducer TonB [Pseudomonadota bacterium]
MSRTIIRRVIAPIAAMSLFALTAAEDANAQILGRPGNLRDAEKLAPKDRPIVEAYCVYVYTQLQSRMDAVVGPRLFGTVVVRMIIAPSGRINSAKVVRGSGYSILDARALKTIRETGPFRPPPRVRNFDRTFNLTVVFR